MATNTGKILLAVATGAALGATLGMLFAPEKGSKTRRRLTGSVAKTADDYIDDLVSEGKKTWKNAQKEGENMSDDIEGYLAHIAKEGKKSWREFQANAEAAAEKAKDAAGDVADGAESKVSTVFKEGKRLWNDLTSKAENKAEEVKDTVVNAADTVKNKAMHTANNLKAEMA